MPAREWLSRPHSVLFLVLGAASAWAAACGGDSFQSSPSAPSDISGDYVATLTNGTNDCQFANWTAGSTANVRLDVQQTGSSATATVTGVAGLLFDVILGGMPQFQGTVSGDSFNLVAVGTNASKDGQCSYTIKATLTGTLTGDAIQGNLTYSETTNGSSDCSYHATCTSVEAYAGARAPDAGGGD